MPNSAAASPLKVVVAADPAVPKIWAAWQELEPRMRKYECVQVLDVDTGHVDYGAVSPDLVVVIGGDGAILRASRQMDRNQFPLVGVNVGRLGFLADLSHDEFLAALPQICERRFSLLECLMYECTLYTRAGERQEMLGLNEVVISAAGSLRMIEVHLAIDGEPVTRYSCDGLIISTPVGSTAHSLSAGGPILRQDLQAFVITPICPHALTMRPLVDSADSVFALTVPSIPDGVFLVVDGQVKLPLSAGDRVEVRRADVRLKVAKVPGASYYATLHRKLSWGGQPNYRPLTPAERNGAGVPIEVVSNDLDADS